jgi:DNA-binding NarL/FixJ family response regulator
VRDDRSAPSTAHPRICVVEGPVPPYERLGECNVEIMAVVPTFDDLEPARMDDIDVVILGCSDAMLASRDVERRIAWIADRTRVLGVAAALSADALARAARIGFHGFVAGDIPPAALDRSIAAVVSGEFAFPRSAISALIRLIRGPRPRLVQIESGGVLTPRQWEIADLIAAGANDREIAERLRIKPATVHKHVQNALKRTQTRTRSQLAASLATLSSTALNAPSAS